LAVVGDDLLGIPAGWIIGAILIDTKIARFSFQISALLKCGDVGAL